jgi:hypothetical protein
MCDGLSIAQVIGSLLVSAVMCGIKLSVIPQFPDIFKRSKELKLTLSMLQHDDPEVQACDHAPNFHRMRMHSRVLDMQEAAMVVLSTLAGIKKEAAAAAEMPEDAVSTSRMEAMASEQVDTIVNIHRRASQFAPALKRRSTVSTPTEVRAMHACHASGYTACCCSLRCTSTPKFKGVRMKGPWSRRVASEYCEHCSLAAHRCSPSAVITLFDCFRDCHKTR